MNVSHPRQLQGGHADTPKFAATIDDRQLLAISTHTGKVFIQDSPDSDTLKTLQINHKITALSAVNGIIVVGTAQYVLALNPSDASTIFYRPVADEVTVICTNSASTESTIETSLSSMSLFSPRSAQSTSSTTLIYAGGQSGSITGLDRSGTDTFWTVVDSKVTALFSLDKDLLLAGTQAGRILKVKVVDNQIVEETVKADAVVRFCGLGDGLVGYQLANGTIGVIDSMGMFSEKEDVWRMKSKHSVVALEHVTELGTTSGSQTGGGLLVGFGNGRLEIRMVSNGEVFWEHTIMNTKLIGIAGGQLAVDSGFGVHQLSPYDNSAQIHKNTQRMAVIKQENESLLFEQVKKSQSSTSHSQTRAFTKVPKVDVQIKTSPEHRAIILAATIDQRNWIVRSITCFADGLWLDKECKVQSVDFSSASQSLTMILVDSMPQFHEIRKMRLDVRVAISVKSSQVQSFESVQSSHILQPLQFYFPSSQVSQSGLPYVEIPFTESPVSHETLRSSWQDLFGIVDTSGTEIRLVSCFDDTPLIVLMHTNNGVLSSSSSVSRIQFYTESISIAAFLVQFVAKRVAVTSLSSTCNGYSFGELRENFLLLDDLKQTVERLKVEVNEIGNMSKAALIHLEDGRKRGDAESMKSAVQALSNFNRDLRQMAGLKQTNTARLKAINTLIHRNIQIGCRLRVGQASSELMTQCMNVLKNVNSESNETLASSLINLIQYGVNL